MSWFIYLLQCTDKYSSYYIGITTDVKERLAKHNAGKGSKFVKSRRPAKVLYSFLVGSKSEASKLECKIKKLKRPAKLKFFQERLTTNF